MGVRAFRFGKAVLRMLDDAVRQAAASFKAYALSALPVAIAAAVQSTQRDAKSSASLACHARAVSVTARWAAMRSSTARRR